MKKVMVIVTGTQRGEDGSETVVETRAQGAYYERDGSHYLLYQEPGEDRGVPCRNRLKLTGSTLELTRRGEGSSHMIFEPGRTHAADYATPFGSLKMDVSARWVESSLQEDVLEIRADYFLTSQDSLVSDCLLHIRAEGCGA